MPKGVLFVLLSCQLRCQLFVFVVGCRCDNRHRCGVFFVHLPHLCAIAGVNGSRGLVDVATVFFVPLAGGGSAAELRPSPHWLNI